MTKVRKAADYFVHGKKLFVDFVEKEQSVFPTMFPRVPCQQYIDRVPEQDFPAAETQINDKFQQDNYESEVMVFRALERLKGQNLLVLHSVKYTHFQYRMWEIGHNPKKCTICQRTPKCDEGENDFIVIGPNYIVLIEVKNPNEDLTYQKELLDKAEVQLKKSVSIIEGMLRKSDDSLISENVSFHILRFVAFPCCDSSTHERGDIPILCAPELEDIEKWWESNILEQTKKAETNYKGNFNEVKHALLALWATEHTIIKKSRMQISKVIKDTDEKLREGHITFFRKNGSNPNIDKTAGIETAEIDGINIFKVLNIEFITKAQRGIFEKQVPKLVITGCVGSGKSLLLIARLLHRKLTQVNSKMALLVFNQLKLVEYVQIFKDAKIEVTDVSEVGFNPEKLQTSVVIIHCSTSEGVSQIPDLIKKLPEDFIVYIDDAHASSTNFSLLNWESLAVDLNQSHLTREGAPNWNFDNLEVGKLTDNYRSTHEIVSYLEELSVFINNEDETQKNLINAPPRLIHHPSVGHLIHGPLLAIDVWRIQDSREIPQLLKSLVGNFYVVTSRFGEEGVTCKCIILAPPGDPDGILKSFGRNEFNRHFCVVVDPNEQNIYSTEFAACLILLQFSNLNTRTLRLLFNVLSRARVFCHIKIIVKEFEGNDIQIDELKTLLSIFKGAKVSDQKYTKQ